MMRFAPIEKPEEFVRVAKQLLHDMKQDLCYYCGKYSNAHEGACNGCRWKEM